MGLVDGVLEAESASRKGPACEVGKVIAARKDGVELSDALKLALERKVKWSTIAAHVASEDGWGIKLPAGSLSRHARGVCSCGTI